MTTLHEQLRHPNFMSKDKLYLIRCYHCSPTFGKENYSASVASGICAWCGWKETTNEKGQENE